MGNNASFPGTQNYLNNGIGTSNYVNTGGFARGGVPGVLSNPAPAGGANLVLQNWDNNVTSGLKSGTNSANALLNTEANPQFGAANPYLRDYANAAMLPTIQNYENAVAPNLLANFAGNGTVGGSGQQNAFGLAESGLAQGLGTESANIYEPAWSQQSAQQAQALSQQSAQSANAANLAANAGYNAAGQASGNRFNAYENALNLTGQSIGGSPNLASGAYIPEQQLMSVGGVGQNQAQNVLNTAYGNLYQQGMWPYTELQQLGGGLGNYPQGSGSAQTTSSGGGSMK